MRCRRIGLEILNHRLNTHSEVTERWFQFPLQYGGSERFKIITAEFGKGKLGKYWVLEAFWCLWLSSRARQYCNSTVSPQSVKSSSNKPQSLRTITINETVIHLSLRGLRSCSWGTFVSGSQDVIYGMRGNLTSFTFYSVVSDPCFNAPLIWCNSCCSFRKCSKTKKVMMSSSDIPQSQCLCPPQNHPHHDYNMQLLYVPQRKGKYRCKLHPKNSWDRNSVILIGRASECLLRLGVCQVCTNVKM